MNVHRVKQLFRYNFLSKEEVMSDPWKTVVLNNCLGMYDWSLSAKFFLNWGVSVFFEYNYYCKNTHTQNDTFVLQMFGATVTGSGSERHRKFVDAIEDMTVRRVLIVRRTSLRALTHLHALTPALTHSWFH